jgi:hypothetical protein
MSKMDRRAFIGISGAAGLMPLAGAAQGAERVGQPYLELRKFIFETEAQRAAFDEMMAGSGIAAFNRMGINPVGVFCEAKSFSPVHLLLPHPNAESALNLVANLLADSAYAQKAAPFIDAPKAALPYKEVETWLLRAFQKMPRVERPATTAGRIFQLRIYESPSIQTAAKKVEMFEKAGELENTLVIVTSDNGMPFPRGKANCYEYGCHMPLAVAWPARVVGGRTVDDLVGFVDLTATMLEAAGVEHPNRNDKALAPAGRSLMNILVSGKGGIVDPTRQYIYAARERHSSSRYNNWTYPVRCMRSEAFLYVRNFKPERWPAGDPQELMADGAPGPMHGAYRDIDSGPSLEFLVAHREDGDIGRFFHLAVDKRPGEELYDIRTDPGCLNNLAPDPAFGETLRQMRERLEGYLRETGDPRVLGNGDIWESYPRYSPIRKFPAP